ncbi:DMT family transporter [Paramicrobacterium agarici]|uniref:DMT family transporter n=1 Tax=Paramicrobacterium agarici TaxID=630514 RepID=UPI00115485B6|nr:DMT family transporter [Microbacterium agarici]TQO23750.1 DME family drug/metabolite transporter [Microbacterium agarici]
MHVAGPAGALFVLAASVLWGTTGTAATFAPGVGPLAIGSFAMGVGGMLQAAVAARSLAAHAAALWRMRWTVVIGAVAVAMYPLAFYSSMRLAGVAVGTIVSIGSAPIASAMIERVVDKTPLRWRWGIGTAIGCAGALLLCVTRGGSPGDAPVLGVVLGVVAGITYAAYSFAATRLMRGGAARAAAMGSTFGLGGVLLIPVMLATGAPILASPGNLAVSAYMALIPMFAGYVLFGAGLWRVTSSTATTLSLAEPVVAAILAVLIVGESLPALGWAGMASIGVSILVLVLPARVARSAAHDQERAWS